MTAPAPGDAPLPLPEARRAWLAARLRARLAEVEGTVAARLAAGAPPAGGADLEWGRREAVRACVELALAAIEHDHDRADLLVPPAAVMQARRAARAGLPVERALARYNEGFAALWDLLHEEVEAAEMPGPERAALLREASTGLALVAARVLPLVVAAHAAALARRSPRARAASLVEALLATGGDPSDYGALVAGCLEGLGETASDA